MREMKPRATNTQRVVLLAAGLAVVTTGCRTAAPSAQAPRNDATLPVASSLCPSVSELDFYVPVVPGSDQDERSVRVGARVTLTCSYGDLLRSPRRSVAVVYQLFPPEAARSPKGVTVRPIRAVGSWAISYQKGDLTHVVVDQGLVAVSVVSNASPRVLLGLAEEELSRVPVADRS